jgi:hypothetical protein
MKIILLESQLSNLKTNLNEDGPWSFLKKLITNKNVTSNAVTKGLLNPINFKTINGKSFIISSDGGKVSLDAINSMVDDIARGKVTIEQALSNFPKKLKDGTDFKELFRDIPKVVTPNMDNMSNPDVEKMLSKTAKAFKEERKNRSWYQPINNEILSGWKFHVYADNMDEVAYLYEKLLPVAKKHNAGFKLAGELNIIALREPDYQRGKAVTLYVNPNTFRTKTLNVLFNDIKSAVSSYPVKGNIHGDRMLTKNIGYRYELSKPIDITKGVDKITYDKLYVLNSPSSTYNRPNNPDIFK